MPRFSAKADIVARRREAVARLRLRGLSIRAIVEQLPRLDPPMLNPNTGNPYSKSVVASDIQIMSGEWQQDAARAISQHKTEQLALLKEAQSEAWKQKDIDLVLKCHDRIAKLLGTNSPEKQQIENLVNADLLDETERRISKLVEAMNAPKE